jgi:hypothetical protein
VVYGDRISRSLRENHVGTHAHRRSAPLAHMSAVPQEDAQKGQTSHPPSPRRAETRLVPGKAAVSEGPRRTLGVR